MSTLILETFGILIFSSAHHGRLPLGLPHGDALRVPLMLIVRLIAATKVKKRCDISELHSALAGGGCLSRISLMRLDFERHAGSPGNPTARRRNQTGRCRIGLAPLSRLRPSAPGSANEPAAIFCMILPR